MTDISITICGDGGCGKSSMTLRLVRSQFVHEYDPTVEDSYSVTRTVDGLPYFLSITDTAGQEEYRGLWTKSTLQSDAFLLVYDMTNPGSLETLNPFMEMINTEAEQRVESNQRIRKELGDVVGVEMGMPPPVIIVAGNKCDLKNERVVASRDGLDYARKNNCGFMETSAREMVNIEETFALLVRRVVTARRLHSQQNSTPARRSPSTGPNQLQTTLPLTAADGQSGSAETKLRGRWWSRKDRKVPEIADFRGAQLEEVEARGCILRRLCCG